MHLIGWTAFLLGCDTGPTLSVADYARGACERRPCWAIVAAISNDDSLKEAREVLRHYDLRVQHVARLGSGLTHDTFSVRADSGEFVLQRVHPVFGLDNLPDIKAVTEHLARKGKVTLRLVATQAGELGCVHRGRCWRVLTRVAGVTFDAVRSPQQAHEAGAELGRFHAALHDLRHTFVGGRTGVHDTPRHLRALKDALRLHSTHPLYNDVAALASDILHAASVLPAVPDVPVRLVHGDPKFSNILFAGVDPPGCDRPVALIDLDTVAVMPMHLELGDAWRSWCNVRGEDEAQAELDLEVFEAACSGYARAGPELTAPERQALVFGLEIIALELSARFAADALCEQYFRWNTARYSSRGHHNLVRARGQFSLYQAAYAGREVIRSAIASTMTASRIVT